MKQQKERDRFSTQSSIKWFLDVGYHLGTLTETQARRLAGVNRTTFDRWLRGESSAPRPPLNYCGFMPLANRPAVSALVHGMASDFKTDICPPHTAT